MCLCGIYTSHCPTPSERGDGPDLAPESEDVTFARDGKDEWDADSRGEGSSRRGNREAKSKPVAPERNKQKLQKFRVNSFPARALPDEAQTSRSEWVYRSSDVVGELELRREWVNWSSDVSGCTGAPTLEGDLTGLVKKGKVKYTTDKM
ncbi:hypothetical protein TREES_T100002986 [Tupaia chinensis]|uniref:Uncharacterized protein n=1 Tax=Tupaia chinensis TaxID=246437 RepID=L9KQ52_TUPCH|nr:hypothetical protein TREES_T100002986 [Tupaia chinensis]